MLDALQNGSHLSFPANTYGGNTYHATKNFVAIPTAVRLMNPFNQKVAENASQKCGNQGVQSSRKGKRLRPRMERPNLILPYDLAIDASWQCQGGFPVITVQPVQGLDRAIRIWHRSSELM